MIDYREARPDELEGWNELTVAPVGGHVMQSREWGECAARARFQPRYLIGADGSAVLAVHKRWPLARGGYVRIPGGPIQTADPATIADRLAGATRWLGKHGVDVVFSDPYLPASSRYASELARIGYLPAREIQPPWHRVSVPLGPDLTEEAAFERLSPEARERIRRTEQDGLRIVRYDRGVRRGLVEAGFAQPEREVDWSFAYFHVMLQSTAEGQTFDMLSRLHFLDWAHTSYEARHTIYLEAMNARSLPIAGLMLSRHGDRYASFLTACLDTTPEQWPGAFDLLRWRAIQLAIRAGRSAIDLDGAGATGFRQELSAADYGVDAVELTGAHEFVVRPRRYLAGRVATRTAERLRRKPPVI
jgi:hypothetical protein